MHSRIWSAKFDDSVRMYLVLVKEGFDALCSVQIKVVLKWVPVHCGDRRPIALQHDTEVNFVK